MALNLMDNGDRSYRQSTPMYKCFEMKNFTVQIGRDSGYHTTVLNHLLSQATLNVNVNVNVKFYL